MAKKKKLLVIQVAALGWDLIERHRELSSNLSFQPLEPVFPAVTCTAQATFRTAALPCDHGMVGNGIYFRDLQKPMFWEQAASLVHGERIWSAFREQGGTVGMMFWQQSLGEDVDMVLSPKPIHKHGGGMVQDCYSQPDDLYHRLCHEVGRSFNLMHYWGPLASRKSSDWITAATEAVLRSEGAPELLLCYLPHLDYDLQRYGPDSRQAAVALSALMGYLQRLVQTAEHHGYDFLVFGDYAIQPVTHGTVYPNRALRDAGLFHVRTVKGRSYPDYDAGPAVAIVDHEIAHVVTRGAGATEKAGEVLAALDGVERVLDRAAQKDLGLDHPRSGDLVLLAEEGTWFAYPWWTAPREAPDYATHVDIHNKPGYDPCELFFGWPPPSVSTNTSRVRGSHGRVGWGRATGWATTLKLPAEPTSLVALAGQVKEWLSADVSRA